MRLSILGLGYVGSVCAGCFAKEGHHVLGIDNNLTKVEMLNSGVAPIIEKDMDQIVKEAVFSRKLSASLNAREGVLFSDVILVCVGTPSKGNGSLDLSHLEQVCIEIGDALKEKKEYCTVVIRSTILPGTTEGTLIPILEKRSGKKMGREFGVCYNPEFLREGSAVNDFYHPPKTVIGQVEEKDGALLSELYSKFPPPFIRTSIKVAEMVKYVDNTFHGLKVAFANEVGSLCKELRIDSHDVMRIFCMDEKLNLSSYYLKPGFAFGGSCLPKDIRALMYKSKSLDLDLPLINSILRSNERQLKRGIQKIIDTGKKKVGILGLSFKAGTDDLRESPMVEVVETLIGKGFEVKIYDRNVTLSRLIGKNKKYLEEHIPHISSLMVESLEALLENTEVIVIGNKSEDFSEVVKRARKEQNIIDLVRIQDQIETSAFYEGIGW
ncbi:MAG: UDP-glucose/GDP-mannose dehydrogenase family protein [Candidatus Manganitrophaceae bacterium]